MTRSEPLLFIDCFAGIAGDMMLAALMDLDPGCAEAARAALATLDDLGFRFELIEVERSGVRALSLQVEVEAAQPGRSFAEIRALLEQRPLTDETRRRALEMFAALAQAEGRVHGRPADQVHFHEVGAVDSIVDMVGVAAALAHLDADIHCAPVPLGRGFVRCQHGTLPLPAPATLELLEGVPVRGVEVDAELVTPTGAAILRTQATAFGLLPPLRPRAIGWGAGSRDHPDRPGLLRLVLGEPTGDATATAHSLIEANVDDMTAELAAHCLERALQEGALDAWVAPITMKKGRPAMQLGLLARRIDRDRLAQLLLDESTSIGLRHWEVGRVELDRRSETVDTPFGPIPVKIAGDGRNVAPEYDACRRTAREHDVPVKQVMAAALAAALDRR